MPSEPELKAFLFQNTITQSGEDLRANVIIACLGVEYDVAGEPKDVDFPVVDEFIATASYGDVLEVKAGIAFTGSQAEGVSASRRKYLDNVFVGYIVCIKPKILHTRKA